MPSLSAATLKTSTRSLKDAPTNAGSITVAPSIPPTAEYINARQLCDRWGGISFTTLARYIASDKDMPRPVYFAARNRFFKLSEILAYERQCEVRAAARAMLAADND